MLTVTKEQLAILDNRAREQLEKLVMAHVRQFFPQELSHLDDQAAHRFVNEGVRRAQGLQFSSEKNVLKFVDLLVVLGADFDTRLDWARKLMSEREVFGPDETMKQLLLAADSELRGRTDG